MLVSCVPRADAHGDIMPRKNSGSLKRRRGKKSEEDVDLIKLLKIDKSGE
jgi:hypothetical protein